MTQSEKLDFQNQPSDNSEDYNRKQPSPSNQTPSKSNVEPLDPTRYGDWEKNGRCIDF